MGQVGKSPGRPWCGRNYKRTYAGQRHTEGPDVELGSRSDLRGSLADKREEGRGSGGRRVWVLSHTRVIWSVYWVL